MDPTEDLSARVLLKHILSTETPRAPITRSASKTATSSATRSSNRLSRREAGAQTPQDILRRSLRHKIHESITRQSLPATKRRTASVRKLPASTSVLFEDGDTPRHILKNILRTELVKSPVVHEKAVSEEPQPSSAASSITRKRTSLELSGLDLPDLTIGNISSTEKALSRKRPRRSLNVTAFEKRLKDGGDVGEKEESIGDHSSLSLSSLCSSTSLSLKTPLVDVQTEKKGLQRRVSNRRKISEEEFCAAVNKRQMEGLSSFVQLEQGLSETALSEGFSLGQSKLGGPDITANILHCDTALYARPDAMTSSFSFVATQDKPTVMASQLQRQMEQEEQMEAEQSKLGKEKSMYAFPTEEGAEPQIEKGISQSEEDADAAEFQKDKEKSTSDGHLEDAAAVSEEDENRLEIEEGAADSHTEEDAATRSQSEEEEPATVSQTEEEGAGDSQTEEKHCGVDSQPEEDVTVRSQSEEEDVAPDSQTEEEGGAGDSQIEKEISVDLQSEEDVTARSQSEEEDVAPDSQTEEGGAGDSQIEKEISVDLQSEEDVATRSQSEEEEGIPDCQPKEGTVDLQSEEDVATRSQSEEEEGAPDRQTEEEEGAVDLQPEEDVSAKSQSEEEGDLTEHQSDQEDPAANSQSESGDLADSQPEYKHDEKPWEEDGEQASEQQEQDLEHISQRARHSEGRLIMPVKEAGGDLADATEEGWSDGKSKAHSSLEMESRESGRLRIGIPDVAESSTQEPQDACCTEAEPDADKENSFNLPERTHDIEESRHLSDHSPEEEAAQQEEEWEDEEEEESSEISSKTPAFVRQKINFFQPDSQASSSAFKNIQVSGTGEAFSAPKPKKMRQRRKGPAKTEASLPKSYLMGVFKHFAKTNVSADVYPVLQDIMDKYFDRLAVDLETYAVHAKRKTIEVEDAELLLKRQGHVNDKVPVEVLIEKYLRMDQRKLLIPIATSGNVVIPKTRR
ncbi:centromere protein T isoform X2 [Etheostoma spectabile]|uniref:centromere protein T isoform X2 n=1 Tax=Etheostoma spectabile TaxID=54343 RepID=UPI0013AF96E0|nr:centromere protein T isoform X2 [Etheostoma spectabile]